MRAPEQPALMEGRVIHLRRLPDGKRRHRFRYAVFRLTLDLDQIDETTRRLRFLSHNRFNLLGFHDRDHGARDGTNPRARTDALVMAAGGGRPARVLLTAFPRVLGYAFNPLALYTCYDESGALTAVIYEVRNTDGDLCPYVFRIGPNVPLPCRHGDAKRFYVSPFISAEQRYRFVLHPPSDAGFALHIRVDGPEGLTLIAAENAIARGLTDRSILSACVRAPFMTLKIIAGIYWEALRLRLKGARFFRHPGNDGRYVAE